jgi:hypothetical protein
MWDSYWDKEEFESMQDWVDLGERVVQRMFREARVEQAAELEMEWRKEREVDQGEGTSTGAEKQRGERQEMVSEESEDVMEIDDSEEDGDGSEMDKIEDGEVVEVQGKGKEKVMEKGMEENTLT